jgi:uncharacterized membrane protein YphA (DoxX/SURF4 family)
MTVETAEMLRVIGRLLLAGLFVAGGIRHFFILPVLTQVLSTRGVPAPRFVLVCPSSSLSLGCFYLGRGWCQCPWPRTSRSSHPLCC